MFSLGPKLPLVTLTMTVQVPPALRRALVRLMVVPLAGALSMPSEQVVEAVAGVAITIPVGNVSVNERSLTGLDRSGLVMSSWSSVVLPGPMGLGRNDLAKMGSV